LTSRSTAILIPSLNRSLYLADVVKNIRETTPEDHRLYFCVGDQASAVILEELGEFFLWDGEVEDKRYVTRMNKLIHEIHEDEVFFGSDDVVHHDGWLTAARRVMDQGYPVVVVNDLSNPNGTQALMRADNLPYACFDDSDAAFHHGYMHNFADTEQFNTARIQGKLARAMDSVVAHLHPHGHKTFFDNPHELRAPDATYSNAQQHWAEDAALFEKRMRLLNIEYA
jgi:hypothetical protein